MKQGVQLVVHTSFVGTCLSLDLTALVEVSSVARSIAWEERPGEEKRRPPRKKRRGMTRGQAHLDAQGDGADYTCPCCGEKDGAASPADTRKKHATPKSRKIDSAQFYARCLLTNAHDCCYNDVACRPAQVHAEEARESEIRLNNLTVGQSSTEKQSFAALPQGTPGTLCCPLGSDG